MHHVAHMVSALPGMHAAIAVCLQASSGFWCLTAGGGKPRYQARKHLAGRQSQASAEDL